MSNDLNSVALNKLLQAKRNQNYLAEKGEEGEEGEEEDVYVAEDGVCYNIVFDGLVRADFSEETVKANLAQLYKCDLSHIEGLFGGKPRVIKHGLSGEDADKYVWALHRAGAIARKEVESAVTAKSDLPAPRAVDSFPVVAELKRIYFKSPKQVWMLLAVAMLIVLAVMQFGFSGAPPGTYLSDKVSMGALTVRVAASGTLKPTRSVDVGSELSGTLASVLVQENDYVKKGQLLAQLDTSQLEAAVIKSQAVVASGKANVAHMEATVAESQENLARMRQLWQDTEGKAPAKSELDTAEAGLKRADAQLKSALADVAQAQAVLETDRTNIRKAAIISPVDGVVLARKVEPGQTVVAAMTIPVLFTIAEDLTQMELHVNVDEADVAHVVAGQKATFTVAAWNGRQFSAQVERVYLGSTITDNVVTYTAVLSVPNSDLALRPGMTASAEIITAQRDNVLLVPNAALRFNPEENGAQQQQESSLFNMSQSAKNARKRLESGSKTQVWVLEGKQQLRAVPVQIGASDGSHTEVLSGELKNGARVVVEYQEARK
ncbi:MAG: efflux RND transporter periplasmic adaptor subunit [Azoarcus sp.]|jgi:HlyD family secretion protein|nr:efflux RND transporter periplasmic adaptor subunit [Azoarcus sp.]